MGERQLPELYPGWKTVRKLGSGSFGTVYEIERDLFGKIEKAALKCIAIPRNDGDVEEMYSNGYDDASITAHFETYLANIVREYSMMVEMKGHTNVVYCDDIRYVPREDGIGWDITIKMELLTPLIKTLGPDFGEEQVIRLGKDLCRALALCKERDIVHRDIKPQNIFVSKTGDYKLGDFGIAKTVEQTTGGTKIGTYSYMAPEVYHNKPYGSSADIYSLGLVMYWLLNERRLPFLPLPPKSPTYDETEMARHRRFMGEAIPAPKKGSEELERIVLKACAFDPKDRYASAQEMLDALERIGQAEPVVNKVEVQEEAPQTLDEKMLAWSRTAPADVEEDKTMGLFFTSRPAAEVKKVPAAIPKTEVLKAKQDGVLQGEIREEKTAPVFDKTPVEDKKVEASKAEPQPLSEKLQLWSQMANAGTPNPAFESSPEPEKKTELVPVRSEPKPEEEPVRRRIEVPKRVPQSVEEQSPQKNKLWVIGAFAAVVLAVGLAVYSMYHVWSDATCTAPATCSICGKVGGVALGHQWESTNCNTPVICSTCGQEGVTGHQWMLSTGQLITCPHCGLRMEGFCPPEYDNALAWTIYENDVPVSYCADGSSITWQQDQWRFVSSTNMTLFYVDGKVYYHKIQVYTPNAKDIGDLITVAKHYVTYRMHKKDSLNRFVLFTSGDSVQAQAWLAFDAEGRAYAILHKGSYQENPTEVIAEPLGWALE